MRWKRVFRFKELHALLLGTVVGAWVMSLFFAILFLGVIVSGQAASFTAGAWIVLALSSSGSVFLRKSVRPFWRYCKLIERYTSRDRRFKDRQVKI